MVKIWKLIGKMAEIVWMYVFFDQSTSKVGAMTTCLWATSFIGKLFLTLLSMTNTRGTHTYS